MNRLNRLNENVLSPNKFEQVTLEDNVKEIINIEQYDNNSNNNPTKDLQLKNYTLVKLEYF